MSNQCGMYYSDLECQILMKQIERRARYRQEFLRRRTDPCMHSKEAGYVFDDGMQRFTSMKVCQFEYFKASPRTSFYGMFFIVMPMFTYGYLVWNERSNREHLYRCGKIKYRDRIFKFA